MFVNIYEEIESERERQTSKGYTLLADSERSLADFAFYIRNYLGWAEQMESMGSPDKAHRRMVQVAALAVAYLESRPQPGEIVTRPFPGGSDNG